MRSAIIVSALVGLAAASPVVKRQDIEFDQYDDADQPTLVSAPVDASAPAGSYDAAAAAAAASQDPVAPGDGAVSKRDSTACGAKQPVGYGPVSSPDDSATFLADPQFPSIANAAVTPDGYSLAFSALNGATEGSSYITYKTMKTYDTLGCQQFCDAHESCYFFNMYMERDPTTDPTQGCPNPASTTNYKCALFGAQQDDKTATNRGQGRWQFNIAIAGSNGYNKLAAPAAAPGFTGPVELGGAINAPDNSYMGYKYYPGPYNAAQCTNACMATSSYNKAHPKSDGSYNTCSFVNSYVLSKNGSPQGTYCSMYTKTWDRSFATNIGQYRGSDYYSTSQSYGWILNTA